MLTGRLMVCARHFGEKGSWVLGGRDNGLRVSGLVARMFSDLVGYFCKRNFEKFWLEERKMSH